MTVDRPSVLVFTPWFRPHLGGVETTVDLLVRELVAEGCSVTVLTTYPSGAAEQPAPVRVLRRPNLASAWHAVRGADVILMFGPSLRFLWMPLLQRKRLVINHFTWIDWRPRPVITAVQRMLALAACNVAPSRDLAQHVGGSVMPNPFDDAVFHEYGDVARDGDLVFLGRLKEDKGLRVLLEALRLLRNAGEDRKLCVIGTGPDGPALRSHATQLGIGGAVEWRGSMTGPPLARELARHRTLVAPSLCREAFGIVVLEGLACGCSVVCSDRGGLPEAAGGLGVTCPAGDPSALVDALKRGQTASSSDQAARDAHLARYRPAAVARRYLDLFSRLGAA